MGAPVNIDIIILSYARDAALKRLTQNTLDTLWASEPANLIRFNVVVIESNHALKPFQYTGTKTIYPEQKFGYNKFMNIGIRLTNSPYVCMCNNDLLFHKGWASAMLSAFAHPAGLESASPLCSVHHPGIGINPDTGILTGYEVRKELAGWCIFFRRKMLEKTGLPDPRFRFWYADNDYGNTLQKLGLKHALVTSSIVDHLESQTLLTKTSADQQKLTAGERFYYEYKWEGRSYLSYLNRLRKFRWALWRKK